MSHLFSLIGVLVILALAVGLSSNRRWIRLRVVGAAFALQAGIAVLVLYVPAGRATIAWLARGVGNLLAYAGEGTAFLFGPFAASDLGRNFALQALPVIIFFASLVSILYHLGVMQRVVRWLGGALEAVIGISKVEALCAAANIFVGQSEAPLVIRPYLAGLRPTQLFQVMTSGMAGVAGTILAAYASMGVRIDYLLAASFMSAPGAILMAKIIMPDDPEQLALPITEMVDTSHAEGDERPANVIMAAAQGAQLGVRLAVMVGAMVFAFVGLVALGNGILTGVGEWVGIAGLTFQRLLGFIFAPVMALLGVPWSQAGLAGGLFGEKIVLNEFVAYIHMEKLGAALDAHAQAVATFALCGFANFSSIAIQMAVTGGLAPNQRPLIAKLGIKALLAGSLANLMSAALAGMLVG
ncbi:NupC/NupG family nucleoside CNT transporter [Sphingomonas nostoxanthinifaciens]|uniref:NupC/NupG family nucleoside CNT transporter n=1 Tax=Sphingomonas nostoxanthinifaciens TaxID=2872652 RepID=UPI001CC213C4|nr:nucleoside transporter C-terminal domain-containing protein [Sphingomonas nostoxanthinifaciens]UAK25407.1 NupC/NupG family nucleoside CNT transporter [Sphingomonas nostoxanthinifaciens]